MKKKFINKSPRVYIHDPVKTEIIINSKKTANAFLGVLIEQHGQAGLNNYSTIIVGSEYLHEFFIVTDDGWEKISNPEQWVYAHRKELNKNHWHGTYVPMEGGMHI